MAKKQRLKVKKVKETKKKSEFGFWEYVIFGIGGIAAIAVAIWGGYYFGQQTGDEDLTPAIQAIIRQTETLRDKGEFDKAEQVLTFAMKKHDNNELLINEMILVMIDKDELDTAEQLLVDSVESPITKRQSLTNLRDAYREAGRMDDVLRISREIAQIE